jgi:hypothetical protein
MQEAESLERLVEEDTSIMLRMRPLVERVIATSTTLKRKNVLEILPSQTISSINSQRLPNKREVQLIIRVFSKIINHSQ